MGGSERRRHMRARCRIPCDLVVDGTPVSGEVRDVSAGGLGVVAEAPALEQGEPVTLVLRSPGGIPFEISALVWHVRAFKRGANGKGTRSWGLVLADASPEFAQLVEKLTSGGHRTEARRSPRTEPARVSAPKAPLPRPIPAPAAAPAPVAPAPAAAAPSLQQFAIRIRQTGGSRTCRIIACGASEGEAAAAALAEVGAGWTLIDARPLP